MPKSCVWPIAGADTHVHRNSGAYVAACLPSLVGQGKLVFEPEAAGWIGINRGGRAAAFQAEGACVCKDAG